MNAAVFLGRSKTLVHCEEDDPETVCMVQGAATAVASMCGLGYKVVMASNEEGIAAGDCTEADVEAVNERIRQLLHRGANGARIDRFYVCPFDPEAKVKRFRKDHPHRKPQPGMFLAAARELSLDLTHSWTVGDELCDIQAGVAAGTRTILIHRESDGFGEEADAGEVPLGSQEVDPDYVVRNIVEAVRIIAKKRQPEMDVRVSRVEVPQRPLRHPAETSATLTTRSQLTATPSAVTQVKRRSSQSIEPTALRAGGGHRPAQPSPAVKPVAEEQVRPPRVEPSEQAVDSSVTTTSLIEQQLRQILQELRNQRATIHEFSPLKIFAIVLQMVAALCLFGGFWMGMSNPSLFWGWIATGLIVQGATIATLLFAR